MANVTTEHRKRDDRDRQLASENVTVQQPNNFTADEQEAVFVVNANGGVHNVPGSWVTVDNVGVCRVRGNTGYRLAKDEEVDDWYEAQGLDRTDDGTEPDDTVTPQPNNFTVADPGVDVVNPPTGDASASKARK